MRFQGNVTEHFKWSEFIREEDERRVTGADVLAIRCLATYVLEPLRKALDRPIKITSGFRTPEHNEAVGGAQYSQHLLGEAVDIVVPGATPKEVATKAVAVGAFKVIEYDDHVHVSIPSRDLVHHSEPMVMIMWRRNG